MNELCVVFLEGYMLDRMLHRTEAEALAKGLIASGHAVEVMTFPLPVPMRFCCAAAPAFGAGLASR